MNPLFEKYFFGELTVPEEDKLEKLLETSTDAAWDFGQEAERIYASHGLPEPKLPRGPGGGNASLGFGGKLGLWSFLAGGLLAGVAFYWWQQQKPAPVVYPVEKPLPKAVTMFPAKAVVPTTTPVRLAPAAPPPGPTATPTVDWGTPPAGEPDKVSGDNLKVVVHRQSQGPVLVRIVNAAGVEVRRLFSGTLQEGRWGFEWDGRGNDGKLVETGKYRIEVDTDGLVQSRVVNIR